MTNDNKYIVEAKKYYQIALEESEKSKANGKIEYAVDVCDKAWLSLNLAIKAMFIQKEVKEQELPKAYRGVSFFLKKYGDRKLRRIYDSAYGRLHIQGFWERDVDFDRVKEVMEDVKQYIDEIEQQNITK